MEKDPGLLGRLATFAVVVIACLAVGIYTIAEVFVLHGYGYTHANSPNGVYITRQAIPWFAWGGPLTVLLGIGLVLLMALGYFGKVLRPQLKGR
jgi:hypothetical protein